MKSNTYYKCFDDFIFRVPYLHNQSYKEYDSIIGNKAFMEAVYIASADFSLQLPDTGKLDFDTLSLKFKLVLLKYMLRISTRCTPFGLFAGCGVAKAGSKTLIEINSESFRASSTIDLSVLSRISQLINEKGTVLNHAIFYPNTTIYPFGDTYRYMETKVIAGKQQHVLTEVTKTDYLEDIIAECFNGAHQKDLVALLIRNEYIDTELEGMDFLAQLIEDKLIVSDLAIGVTIGDNLTVLIDKIEKAGGSASSEVLALLKLLSTQITRINREPIGSRVDGFKQLQKAIKNNIFTDGLNKNNLIRTNLFVNPLTASISPEITKLVYEGLKLLNILNPVKESSALDNFKNAFFEKYEHEEIDLCEALDPDVGIGFANFNMESIRTDVLIKGIVQQTGKNYIYSTANTSSFRDELLHRKYNEYLAKGNKEIFLDEKDLAAQQESWDDLPLTFPVGIEVIKAGNAGDPLIFIKFAGGFSASNVIGRFTNDAEEISEIAGNIAAFERENIPSNSIIAEIAYLPEDETGGNLLSRKLLHNFEIPIFSASSLNETTSKIHVSDLTIAINADHELLIRSKSLNKYIIPRNSTAHSFSNQNTPLYYFLSAMQGQHKLRTRFTFDWGNLIPVNGFYPRITYKRQIIISLARWIIYPYEINKEEDFITHYKCLFKERGIPQLVNLNRGSDSRLLLDFNNDYAFEMLRSEMKDSSLVLEEYLFDQTDALITSVDGSYNNEVIFNFYKSAK